MSFDPNLPANGSQIRAGELRDQFNGLKGLIDAGVPGPAGPPGEKGDAGEQGPQGEQGPVGSDGAPGSNGADGQPGPAGADGRGIADVYDSGDGRAMVRMSDGTTYGPFTVASGPQGIQGERGSDGGSGPEGPAGPEGRHVTNVRDNGDGRAIVDMSDGSSYGPFWVSSGPAGPQGIQGERGNDGGPGPQGPVGSDGRSITNVRDSGDGRAIVDMSDGSSYGPFTVAGGPAGPPGGQGDKGDKGDPGDVSSQQLSDAIGGTSANSNSVQPLDTTGFSDPPTLNDLLAVANKLNELITTLRR